MFFKPEFIKDAQERRRLLMKVYYYRRSQLHSADLEELRELTGQFDKAIRAKEKALLKKLESDSDKLLKKLGGHYYRNYHLFENIETFVVAAILAIGIRSFFLQPFKIPTNSMWPTYHGMTYTIHKEPKDVPTGFGAAMGAIFQGTSQHKLVAPADGELYIGVFSEEEQERYHAAFRYEEAPSKILGIIPTKVRRYQFFVGDAPATLDVPLEFNGMDKLLFEKYFSSVPPMRDNYLRVRTGVRARAGEPVLNFQIETGDMLFVDRFTYNFVPPNIGDPIVFRTRSVHGLTILNGGKPDDKYYIKRLVGMPGDKLSVEGSTLIRNGQPIEGSPIFAKNALKSDTYHGYEAKYDLDRGNVVDVPPGSYYAFGDNSPESLDSRVWGGLPKDQVVGRAVFIYYPFTERWGFSQ